MFSDSFPSQTPSPFCKEQKGIQNTKCNDVIKKEQRKPLSSFSLPPSPLFLLSPLVLKKKCILKTLYIMDFIIPKRYENFFKADIDFLHVLSIT